jgi:hypothetical protein
LAELVRPGGKSCGHSAQAGWPQLFNGNFMQVFYIDEAGCTGALASASSPIQPVFVLGGVILPQGVLRDFTLDWLHL